MRFAPAHRISYNRATNHSLLTALLQTLVTIVTLVRLIAYVTVTFRIKSYSTLTSAQTGSQAASA